jgi:hypothetical protein
MTPLRVTVNEKSAGLAVLSGHEKGVWLIDVQTPFVGFR